MKANATLVKDASHYSHCTFRKVRALTMIYHISIINENENEIFVNEAKNVVVNENENETK